MGKYTNREPRSDLEDLRDDTIAVVLNSKMTFKEVEDAGGPTRATLSKWLYRETKFPRLDTVRSALQACGHDFAVVPLWNGVTPDPVAALRPNTTEKLPARKKVAKRHVRASKSR